MSRDGILGPLTTTYAIPTTCAQVWYTAGNLAYYAQRCASSTAFEDNTGCWPPITSTTTLKPPFLGGGFYSPAHICPVGYETACTAIAGSGFPFQYALTAGETAVGCCPTGFACYNGGGAVPRQTCRTSITSGDFTIVPSCGVTNEAAVSPVLFLPIETPYTAGSTVTTTSIYTITVEAPLFQLNIRTDQLTASQTSTPTSTALVSSTSATQTSTISSTSGGLKTGGKAGLGVGIGLIVVLLIGAGIYWAFRKRKRRSTAFTPRPPRPWTHETDGTAYQELEGDGKKPLELDSSIPLAELDAPENDVRRE